MERTFPVQRRKLLHRVWHRSRAGVRPSHHARERPPSRLRSRPAHILWKAATHGTKYPCYWNRGLGKGARELPPAIDKWWKQGTRAVIQSSISVATS